MDRHSLVTNLEREGDYEVAHREDARPIPITLRQLEDLAHLWAADVVDQIERRRDEDLSWAREILAFRGLLCPSAAAELETVARFLPV